jgi:hypothetical protein
LREIEANRRVHEELQASDSGVAPRRSRNSHWVQGLKPLATIVPSLRDFYAMGENGQTPGVAERRTNGRES